MKNITRRNIPILRCSHSRLLNITDGDFGFLRKNPFSISNGDSFPGQVRSDIRKFPLGPLGKEETGLLLEDMASRVAFWLLSSVMFLALY